MKTEFASIAEAVAYYWNLGFDSFVECEDFRVMRHPETTQRVFIDKVGFLTVKVSFSTAK